jgi:NAD(P)-dependent dehydrogenase (short-subunit alcohol dehydrogenase family)
MRVAVTGASRGLGLGLCEVLAARGDEVLALCRRGTPELDALGVQVVEGVDVRDAGAMDALSALTDLDAVISNAAVNHTFAADFSGLDLAAVAEEYAVNVIGAMRAIGALLPGLTQDGKVMIVSGGGLVAPGRIASLGNYGYRMSKAALNTFGFLLAEELRPQGIAVVVVNPGVMDTDMHRSVLGAGRGNPSPGVAPVDAARELVDRLDELDLAHSGAWLNRDGQPIALDGSGLAGLK